MSSLVAASLTLTPTSTPKQIYARVGSLRDLRRHANLFEAALSVLQARGGTAEQGDDSVKQHSTCFKLYQAVRSLKKRDNKKVKTERLYPTLEAAFDAHRRRTLIRDCDDEKSSDTQRAEESTSHPTTIDLSYPASSSVSAITIPTAAEAALDEAAPQSIHMASSSTGSHSSRNDSDVSSTSLNHPSDSATTRAIPRHPGEMDEIRRVLYELSQSTSRVHAQLKAVEEEVCSLQTQLGGCQQLLTTWELNVARNAGEDQGLITPAEPVLSSASPIGNRSPSSPLPLPTAQAEPAMEWKEAAKTTNHADVRPASPSQSSGNDDARDDGADDNADTQDDDCDDVVVDEPRGMSGVRGMESESNTRYDSSKRSRSPSEDGEVRRKRQQCNAPSRSDQQADGAAVDATTGSDGRCVWVQSQSEMCKDDLTTIFSHFGRVERVDVPRSRPGSLPFAFVHFEAEEDARWSLRRAVDGAFGCLMVKAYQRRRQARRPSRRME